MSPSRALTPSYPSLPGPPDRAERRDSLDHLADLASRLLSADACMVVVERPHDGPLRGLAGLDQVAGALVVAPEPLLLRAGMADLLDIPLEYEGTQVGLFVVGSRVPRVWREWDVALVSRVAAPLVAELVGGAAYRDRAGVDRRVEVTGRLATTMAHDFNNVMTSIHGHVAVALDASRSGDGVHEHLVEIERAGDRASELTRRLIALSLPPGGDLAPTDINGLVTELEPLLRRVPSAGVGLEVLLGQGLPLAYVDPDQVAQRLAGMVVTVSDAMGGEGRIIVETAAEAVASLSGGDGSGPASGPCVRILVMDGEARQRLSVWLPASPSHVRPEGPSMDIHAGDAVSTILVVEDDDAIRRLVDRVLTRYGHRVLLAGTGDAGLDVARAHAGEVGLVVTDVTLPDMDGLDLARELRTLCPGVPLLLMTGYAWDDLAGRLPDPEYGFLSKPFTPVELLDGIRSLLSVPEAS